MRVAPPNPLNAASILKWMCPLREDHLSERTDAVR